MFMSRTPLDSLPAVDILAAGRTSPTTASATARTSSLPRPSYLQGSHYLARLEQQTHQRALAQRQRQDAQEKNGTSLPSDKPAAAPQQQSYLGIARDVIERTPPHEDDDVMESLPSRWSAVKEDRASGLDVLSDGLEVKYTGPRDPNEREHEARAIRADQPMPVQCGLYYYEVTILGRKHNDTLIGVGFSSKSASLNRAPGWEPESWGYHGDDGHCFQAQNVGKHYGPTFGYGDVIGCGVNFRTGTAFFTKNGHYLGIAFREVKGKLYPSVGLKKTGEHVRVNFGQTPFLFDIDSKEIRQLEKEIEQADTTKLAPPLSETELIQQLVLQFLQHDGYVDTARAFAQEIQSEKQSLCLDPNEEIPGIDIKDDEDANNRQSIRRAILEGDIDKALKHTKASYPQVLEENEQVHFRLRCRKFIEMIRREAETNLVGAGGPKGNHSTSHISGNNGHAQPRAVEDMELDEDLEDLDGAQRDLTQDALLYGQTLQAEYLGDERREVHTALNEIFGLMAYPNPLKEAKVAHLLDRKGRVAVAEELNSAILQSLGKSSRAALENMYAQTSVLLDDLAETGGPGAFVTLQSVIDEIDTPKQGF
ncbi:putative ran-binding protein [Diaporthe ampelina]|uniref:Putative ran-binding protein n=1 Tax=Diaporthe ampelina TaxID=1214573 RepID=A0A0G2FBH1_9PEZI|nr:putative ran-binding protein [Diaporthe ampelina]